MSQLVSIKNVHKSYALGETRVKALQGIDLSIERGDFHALLGTSGSGKSTLLHLIATLDIPDSGSIHFDGEDLSTLAETKKSALRNKRIAMVFQNFNLIPVLNVFENVELPLILRQDLSAEEKKQRVMGAISDVGLQDFQHHRSDQLSGGQRQRVAIARAMVPQPDLVLADEPTANLDSATAHQMIDLLLALNEKRKTTFLFATHDEKLIKRVKSLSTISDGKIKT